MQFASRCPGCAAAAAACASPRHRATRSVRRVFLLMLPVTLGLGLINVNLLIDTFFATR